MAAELLGEAARVGDLRAARAALDNGADVNALDDECVTALHWAAGVDHQRMIHLLISRGANIDAPSCNEQSPGHPALHFAARLGNLASAKALLHLGADMELPPGDAALIVAAAFGHWRIVEALLAAGANPLALSDGSLPHSVAWTAGYDGLGKRLLVAEMAAAVVRLRAAADAARARGVLGGSVARKVAALLDEHRSENPESFWKIIKSPTLMFMQPDELIAAAEGWNAADTMRALLPLLRPPSTKLAVKHVFVPLSFKLAMLVLCWKLQRPYGLLRRLHHLVYNVIDGVLSSVAVVFRLLASLLAVAWRASKHIAQARPPPAPQPPARRGAARQRQRPSAAAPASATDADAALPVAASQREAARPNRRDAATRRAARAVAAAAVQPEAAVAPAPIVEQLDSEPAAVTVLPLVAAEPPAAVTAQVAAAPEVVDAPPPAPVTPILPPSPSPPPPPVEEEETECVVCMDESREAAFAPCGHQVTCVGCAMKLLRCAAPHCPFCRECIKSSTVAHH